MLLSSKLSLDENEQYMNSARQLRALALCDLVGAVCRRLSWHVTTMSESPKSASAKVRIRTNG